MLITKEHKLLIVGILVFLFAITTVSLCLIRENTFSIILIFSVILIIIILLEGFRRLNKAINVNYQQLEAIYSLFFTIKPEMPFPNTRGWAASPDLLKLISKIIFSNKPEFVVEMGSGVSTIVIGYCLK